MFLDELCKINIYYSRFLKKIYSLKIVYFSIKKHGEVDEI